MSDMNNGKTYTSRDVAKAAGVGQSTVSRVLNGNYPVAPETRAKVEKAIRELDYHPNAGARTLRTSHTQVIGLLEHFDAFSGRATIPYLTGVLEHADERGYSVIVKPGRDNGEIIESMAGRRICDGFIVMDVTANDPRPAVARRVGIPTVLVGESNDDHGLDTTHFDYALVGMALAREAHRLGHGHLTLVLDCGPEDVEASLAYRDIIDSTQEACEELGVSVDTIAPKNHDPQGLEAIFSRLFAHRDRRLALVVRSGILTERIVALARRHGLEPGRDLTVWGICPKAEAEAMDEPISYLDTCSKEVTTTAVDLLIDRIESPDLPARHIKVPNTIVTHRATTIPALEG